MKGHSLVKQITPRPRNAYDRYRNSGIGWLGEVPSHWEIVSLRYASSLQTGLTLGKRYEDGRELVTRPYLRVANVQDGYFDLAEITEVEIPPEDVSRYELKSGDVLLTEGGDFDKLGRGYVWDGQIDGCLHQNHIFAVRPDARALDSHFLAALMSSNHGKHYFTSTSSQTTNLASTNSTKLRSFPVLLPPSEEQQAIAAFLDRETAKIDALVEKKRRLIELLKEKRAALVASCLDGQQGSAVNLKRLLSFMTSGSRGWAEFYADDGDLFIQSGNLDRRLGFDLRNVQYIVAPEGAEAERTQVQQGDVLVCITGAYTGNVSVVDVEFPCRAFVNQHISLLRPNPDKTLPRFLAYCLASPIGQGHFVASQYGGTKQGLGFEDISSVRLVLPTVEKQKEVVSFLDDELGKLSNIELLTLQAIERLLEYRTALISAAVTGKIDVREEVAG